MTGSQPEARMIKNTFDHMNGIEIYGVISVCLFVVVFAAAMLRAASLKKPFLNSMSALPLEDDANDGTNPAEKKGESHE